MSKRKRNDGEIVISIRGSVIEVGPWDTQRWARQYAGKPDAPKDLGGMSFGLCADVYLHAYYGEPVEATIQVGGIQGTSPEVARVRIAAFTLATDIAQVFNARCGAGDTVEDVMEWVKKHYASQIV